MCEGRESNPHNRDTVTELAIQREKNLVRQAATAAGSEMAAWARPILLEAAKRELVKSKGKKRRSTK